MARSELLGLTKSAVIQAIGKSKPPLTVLQLGDWNRKVYFDCSFYVAFGKLK